MTHSIRNFGVGLETLHVWFTHGASIRRSTLPLESLVSPGAANFPCMVSSGGILLLYARYERT